MFERKPGYFRRTSSEQVMEKVDQEGHVIGFHVLRASRITQPLEPELAGSALPVAFARGGRRGVAAFFGALAGRRSGYDIASMHPWNPLAGVYKI